MMILLAYSKGAETISTSEEFAVCNIQLLLHKCM